MAKNKPKIVNTLPAGRYRIQHNIGYISLELPDGSHFRIFNNKPQDDTYLYTKYKNNRYDSAYIVQDYTHCSTDEEMFQNELLCNVPMDFGLIVQLQKSLKHHMHQYLYPSKRELCNMKINYIIDTTP